MITSVRAAHSTLMSPQRGIAVLGFASTCQKMNKPAVNVLLLRREFRTTQPQETLSTTASDTATSLNDSNSTNCHLLKTTLSFDRCMPFTNSFVGRSSTTNVFNAPYHTRNSNTSSGSPSSRSSTDTAAGSNTILWNSNNIRLLHTGHLFQSGNNGQPTSNASQMPSGESGDSERVPFSGVIPVGEVEFKYCRSGGAGGQHVNKVATKVELRFKVMEAKWIPDWIKPRLMEQEANRITKHGEFIITSDKTRKQIVNQGDCLNRLRTMIFDASKLPEEPTKEELQLAEKRKAKRAASILKEKRHHSLKKRSRGSQGTESM